MTRKAVQLIIWGDRLVALCSDGTMWADPDACWNKIEAIPGSDDDPHMSEVEARTPAPWRPWADEHSSDEMWCVDTTDLSVVCVPGPEQFVRWADHATKGELWSMVRGSSKQDALRTWRLRETDEVEQDRITIDGQDYPFLTSTIPF